MYKQRIAQGLLASAIVLTLGAGAAAAREDSVQGGIVAAAAAQLAARGDSFQATTASLDVVPVNLAGGCAQAYAFNVRLGAQAPGSLSYKIVTEDGRESQVFEARAEATEDGLFAARATHKLALAESEDNANDPSVVVFDAPQKLSPPREPDFFERLFGTGPAAGEDARHGLRDLAFRVQVVAPNQVASAFDSHSVTCEEEREALLRPVVEDQHDGGRDRPGRDGGGSGTSGGGRGSGRGGAGPAGTP